MIQVVVLIFKYWLLFDSFVSPPSALFREQGFYVDASSTIWPFVDTWSESTYNIAVTWQQRFHPYSSTSAGIFITFAIIT